MNSIKMQHSKFLLFPELSSGEAGENNYVNFGNALSQHNGHSVKAEGLERALGDLKTAIDSVNRTLNNWKK